MKWLGRLFLLGLFFLVGVPLLLPVLEALSQGTNFWDREEPDRLLTLATNSLIMVSGTLLVVLPTGTILALLLFRTNLPGRPFFLSLIVLSVFIPLPVQVTVWQATLGPGSWLPFTPWQFRPGQPWTEGFIPALWVYSLAALPWVIFIIGQNLLRTEREQEEEALLCCQPLRVVWQVTLPRCRGGIVLATLWVAVQVAGEISVTDMFLVRTFAEETYRVFSERGEDAFGQAVLISLPLTLAFGVFLAAGLVWTSKTIPPIQNGINAPWQFQLGPWRWLAWAAVAVVAFLLLGVPMISLAWRAGIQGSPSHWSRQHLWTGFANNVQAEGRNVYLSLVWVLCSGVLTTGISLFLCQYLQTSSKEGQKWVGGCLWGLLAFSWAMPGPITGLGLKKTIQWVVWLFPNSWLAEILYFGSSPLPLIWAYLIRTLPFGVAILWPIYRLFPETLQVAAVLEGASFRQVFLQLRMPFCRRALVFCLLATVALALSETGASKLATTAGIETFTLLVFDRMHYGVAQDVANLCLLLFCFLIIFAGESSFRFRALAAMGSHSDNG